MKQDIVAASFALVVVGFVGLAASGAVVEPSSASTAAYATVAALPSPSQTPAQADQKKSDPPGDAAPLTRDETIKQGPTALEQNCMKCHGSDKWEGTNRDHDGWAAIVNEMSGQMNQAKMPPMSDKTTNLIIDYLTLIQPQ